VGESKKIYTDRHPLCHNCDLHREVTALRIKCKSLENACLDLAKEKARLKIRLKEVQDG